MKSWLSDDAISFARVVKGWYWLHLRVLIERRELAKRLGAQDAR